MSNVQVFIEEALRLEWAGTHEVDLITLFDQSSRIEAITGADFADVQKTVARVAVRLNIPVHVAAALVADYADEYGSLDGIDDAEVVYEEEAYVQ